MAWSDLRGPGAVLQKQQGVSAKEDSFASSLENPRARRTAESILTPAPASGACVPARGARVSTPSSADGAVFQAGPGGTAILSAPLPPPTDGEWEEAFPPYSLRKRPFAGPVALAASIFVGAASWVCMATRFLDGQTGLQAAVALFAAAIAVSVGPWLLTAMPWAAVMSSIDDATRRAEEYRKEAGGKAGRLLLAMMRNADALSERIEREGRPVLLVRDGLVVSFEKRGCEWVAEITLPGFGGRERLLSAWFPLPGARWRTPRIQQNTDKILGEDEIRRIFDVAASALDDLLSGKAAPGRLPSAGGLPASLPPQSAALPASIAAAKTERLRVPPSAASQGAVGSAMVSLSAFVFRLAEVEPSIGHRSTVRTAFRRIRAAAEEMLDSLRCDGADSGRAAALADHLLPLGRSAVEDFAKVGRSEVGAGAGAGDPTLRAALDLAERGLCEVASLFEDHALSLRIRTLESLSDRMAVGVAISRIVDPVGRVA